MASGDVIVRALEESDLGAALDLIFGEWGEIPRGCQERMVRHDPWGERQRSFGAFVEGRLVAHARFHHRPVRIGRARVNMVGVCEVVTHPEYRRRGLGHRVLRAAIEWMRAEGRHVAILYTDVPEFYAGVGWGALAEEFWYVPVDAIPTLGAGRSAITQIPIGEAPGALAEVFDASCGAHPISLVRTPEYWESWPRWAEGNRWFGLLDDRWTAAWEGGRIVAYGGVLGSLRRGGSVGIVEACCLPGHEEALLDVGDALVARCREGGASTVELNLPSDHVFVTKLAPLGERTLNTNARVRVVDVRGMLEALRPELEERAGRLGGAARVRLVSPLGSATVCAGGGGVSVDDSAAEASAELTPAGLGSLLLGYRSAAELAEAGEIEAADATLGVLDVLFPHLRSHYWQVDHF